MALVLVESGDIWWKLVDGWGCGWGVPALDARLVVDQLAHRRDNRLGRRGDVVDGGEGSAAALVTFRLGRIHPSAEDATLLARTVALATPGDTYEVVAL